MSHDCQLECQMPLSCRLGDVSNRRAQLHIADLVRDSSVRNLEATAYECNPHPPTEPRSPVVNIQLTPFKHNNVSARWSEAALPACAFIKQSALALSFGRLVRALLTTPGSSTCCRPAGRNECPRCLTYVT